jgi:Ca-activated chloride channel homolog
MAARTLLSSAGMLICVCLGAAVPRAFALDWSNLWLTPEQRAQRLLDSGHPLEAARMFSDGRRRAYAELEAGDYAAAARELRTFGDVSSQYNRGNALAREGDLRAALASYDAALAQAPDDREVRHNRDLVARALARQSPSGGTPQGGSGAQDKGRGSQNGDSSRPNGQEGAGNQPGSPMGTQTGGASTGTATSGDETEEAGRDAALAAELQRGAKQQGRSGKGATGHASTPASGTDFGGRPEVLNDEWPPPDSEQTLALEQWLRRIPEDPGGLLRRKFLIEHIERHQAAEP